MNAKINFQFVWGTWRKGIVEKELFFYLFIKCKKDVFHY